MSSAAIKAGAAFVEIFARDKTKAGVKSAESGLKSFAAGLSSSAAMVSSVIAGISSSAVVGAMTAAIKHFADAGSEINDMAARTGVGTTALQHLKFAAEQTGASLADVEQGLRRMAKNGRNVGDFEKLGQEIASIQDPSERAARAMEEFGKSGTKLIPMFQELNQLKAASLALGPILSEDEVRRADDMGDAIDALGEAYSRLKQRIGSLASTKVSLDILTGAMVELNENLAGTGGVASSGNPFQDIADMFVRLSKKGAAAGAAAGNVNTQEALTADTEAALKEQDKAAAAGAKSAEQMARSIERANQSRISLIAEFDTPAERFLKKLRQINDALAQLNRNRLMGFIEPGEAAAQQAGLQQAMQRLQQQEQKRIQDELKQNTKKAATETRAEITRGSRGTFSARGAGMLGFGTAKIVTDDVNGKVIVKELVGIRQEIGKAIPVFQ
jgi:hypothetical protein